MTLARMRREYAGQALLESRAPAAPLPLLRRWLRDALRHGFIEPNAMTLATVDALGRPRARMVLLKRADEHGFTFYSNLQSAKARELDARPHAALVLWWPELHRQVRVEGRVARVSAAESDTYFATRPRGAQLGAWASPQSRVVGSRAALERNLAAARARFEGDEVPRPAHWGGFRLVPRAIEFWQGRPDRMHDRLRYTRAAGRWRRARLGP
jgi:pyridoxamine 5'-phosphate oxidase